MDPRYFKDQICDELHGATDYMQKSIDCMKAHPEWSKTFKEMSEMEQEHATDLYKMFMDWYTDSENQTPYTKSLKDAIMECFSKKMRKLEDHKITYEMMVKESSNMMKSPMMNTSSKIQTIKEVGNG